MADKPFMPGVIQPNMEQVIQAGDTLEIEDTNGQKFAIKAVEGESTLAFIKAFDEWLGAMNSSQAGEVVRSALWTGVVSTFRQLPMTIQRDLPSFRTLGTVIAGHSHGN